MKFRIYMGSRRAKFLPSSSMNVSTNENLFISDDGLNVVDERYVCTCKDSVIRGVRNFRCKYSSYL